MNVFIIILSVIMMCYGFINVFKAFKSGGNINVWIAWSSVEHFKRAENPFGFWFMVFANSCIGFFGIYLFYEGLDYSN